MADQTIPEIPADSSQAKPASRRFLGVGFGTGAIAGICCAGTAVAVAAGVSGVSFFKTWMNRYQIYFILLGVALMAAWLIREARRQRGAAGLRAGLRMIARHAMMMAAVFAVTLGVTATAAAIVSM